jgi:hypothetical protein
VYRTELDGVPDANKITFGLNRWDSHAVIRSSVPTLFSITLRDTKILGELCPLTTLAPWDDLQDL